MTVWTIGHGTRPADELVATLREVGVRTVVDVRRFPSSRHNPQFNQPALAARLSRRGSATGMRSNSADGSPGSRMRTDLAVFVWQRSAAMPLVWVRRIGKRAHRGVGGARALPDVLGDALVALPPASDRRASPRPRRACRAPPRPRQAAGAQAHG